MPARLQAKPRGTDFALRPYKRGDSMFLPYEPIGVNQDHPPQELGPNVYSGGNNMLYRNDAAERQGGSRVAFDIAAGAAPFPPQYLLNTEVGGVSYWLYPGADGIGVWDGQQGFDITPAPPPVAATAPAWTGTTLSNVAVLNQADQAPWYWDGQPGNPMLPLPGWIVGSTAHSLRAFKSFLIAMNITEAGLNGGTTVRWSVAADPGQIPTTWIPAPDNDAGDAVLATTPGDIVDGGTLRNSFAIYKDHATHVMQLVGGQFVFIFRKVLSTSGMLSRNCGAEVLGRHVVMSDGDVLLFDGQNADSLIQDRMKRWLFGQIDANNYEACFVQAYQSQSEVWVCFPETGHDVANLAAVWDQNSDSWAVRSLYPESTYIGRGIVPDPGQIIDWDGDAQAWDLDSSKWSQGAFNPTRDGLIASDLAGAQLVEIDTGDLHYDGTDVVAYVEKLSMFIDQAGNQKLVTAVWPAVECSAPCAIEVRIGFQQKYSDPIAWQTPVVFDPAADLKVDVIGVGRLVSIHVASSSATRWRLKGFSLETREAGMW